MKRVETYAPSGITSCHLELPGDRPLAMSATEKIVIAAILVAVAARVAFGIFGSIGALTYRTTDDSYYYFNVARHIVQGQGITFDGINETNGFHPLWMALLLPIFAISHGDAELGLRLVTVALAVIAGTTAWACYRTVRAFASPAAGAVAVTTLIGPWFLNPMLNGLETGILLLQLFLLMWSTRRMDLLSPRAALGKNVFLGVMLAVLFLSRLDTIFIVIAVFVQILWRWMRSCRHDTSFGIVLRKLLVSGGVALALVMPYIVWNVMHFGHLVPISGALKSTFPVISFDRSRLTDFHSLFGRAELAFSLVFLVVVFVTQRRRGVRASLADQPHFADWDILVAMCVGCIVHFTYSMLFMNWAAWWWHYTSYIPLAVVCGGLLFDSVRRRLSSRRTVTAVAIVSVFAISVFGLGLDARRRGKHHDPWLRAARWCNENLAPDAVIGMTDCGLFGYFCKRPTVNLDGVINGYAFQEALRDGGLGAYLAQCGVTHIADYEVSYKSGRYEIRIPARLYKRPGGAIIATPGAEAYRADSYKNAFDDGIHFAVFEIGELEIIDERT